MIWLKKRKLKFSDRVKISFLRLDGGNFAVQFNLKKIKGANLEIKLKSGVFNLVRAIIVKNLTTFTPDQVPANFLVIGIPPAKKV